MMVVPAIVRHVDGERFRDRFDDLDDVVAVQV